MTVPVHYDADEAADFYRLSVLKRDALVTFSINGLEIFRYMDDGASCGPLLEDGKIGFRQLAPLIGEYRDLKVFSPDA